MAFVFRLIDTAPAYFTATRAVTRTPRFISLAHSLSLSRSLAVQTSPAVSNGPICAAGRRRLPRVASLDTNATRAVDSDGNSSGIRRIEKRYLRLNVYIRNPSRTSGLLTRRKRSPIQPCALRGAALPSRLPLSTPRRLFRRASRVNGQRIGVENRPEVERNVVERHVRAHVVVASRRDSKY